MIVRKLRLQKGWSQDQLADLSGLSVRTIQRIERGHPASLESSRSLASVFEVDLSTFQKNEEPAMTDKIEIEDDEKEAIQTIKSIKEFYSGLFAYVVCGVVFYATFGFGEPVLHWIFLGLGLALLLQGLLAFEIISFFSPKWERRLIEKKLGRKL